MSGPQRVRKADLPRDELGRLRRPGQPDAMAHLRGLDDRVEDPADAVDRACALFDEQRYYEAFRHFTAAWLATGKRTGVHRAFAQAAAGLCHVQRGNPEGARRVIARAIAGLEEAVADGADPQTPRVNELDLPALVRLLRAVDHDLDAGREPTAPLRLPRAEDTDGVT